MRLRDRIVVVTGAGGTIGATICRVLAAQGASIGLTDRADDGLDALADELRADGTRCTSAAFDATDATSMEAFVDQVATELGSPDGLVNCAGFWRIVDFTDSDAEHWHEMLSANLLTVLSACRATLPHLLEAERGSIVSLASTAGEYGSVRPSAAYAAAKGGVIAFSKSLAREVSPRGVRVNVVSPGPIDTPMLQAATPEARRETADRTLVGHVGQPDDIAQACVYLTSHESTYVTGEVLRVNGGSLI